MSVVIKSNNVARNHFGTSKMLGTTPELELQKYKARVIADGGVIKDEDRTLKAFELLFNAKCYGHMTTYISGSFGVKFSSSSKLSKLYAIDGVDLIVKIFGNGIAPSLDANNCIDFSSNAKGIGADGALFTTENQHILSKVGNFGFGIKTPKDFKTTSVTDTSISAATWHDERNNRAKIISVSTRGDYFTSGVAKPQFNPVTANISEVQVAYRDDSTHVLLANTMLSLKTGYRKGSLATSVDGEIFKEATTESFYLDFGGAYQSYGTIFNNIVVSDFFFANQLTEYQAKVLSAFQ